METETKARHIETDKVGRSGSLRKRVRPLTYDEHKAAEAAFTGEPCDPAWTQSAQRIYEGLLDAKTKLDSCAAFVSVPVWLVMTSLRFVR